jgi:transcriptional regulator of acetoin/glycerol metabolism
MRANEAERRDTTGEVDGELGNREPLRLTLEWVFPEQRSDGLLGSRLRVGRDDGSEIRLDASGVSRQHAELLRQGPIWVLKDRGSKNGCHVDGQRVGEVALRAGQVLRVGQHVALVRLAPEHASPNFVEVAPGMFGGRSLADAVRPFRLAAAHDLAVVVQGETGTGKELLARAIHTWSGRGGGFHALNCAAIPAELLEAELFGYRKGAFSGATADHLGHLRAAHRGTLFLDEVTELSLAAQAKLLRVLQERALYPLGSTRPEPVDVRVVCACQGSLEASVRAGSFRADLYARLNGYAGTITPLRDRKEDVIPLFCRFLGEHPDGEAPALDAKLVEALCLHDWPQNVRELEQLARRVRALGEGQPLLRCELLPKCMSSSSGGDAKLGGERQAQDLKRLVVALRATGGNVSHAAKRLGFSRQRVYRLLAGRSPAELLGEAAAPEPHEGYDEPR